MSSSGHLAHLGMQGGWPQKFGCAIYSPSTLNLLPTGTQPKGNIQFT